MTIDPSNYSPDVVALNPELFGKRPSRHEALKARPVVQNGQHVEAQARDHKYNAKKTVVDGVTFDSKKEARRYLILKARAAAGEIHALQLQPRFELQPSFKDANGKTIRAIHYVADFQYVEGGRVIVEEVKGYQGNQVWRLKHKLFLFTYPDVNLKVID